MFISPYVDVLTSAKLWYGWRLTDKCVLRLVPLCSLGIRRQVYVLFYYHVILYGREVRDISSQAHRRNTNSFIITKPWVMIPFLHPWIVYRPDSHIVDIDPKTSALSRRLLFGGPWKEALGSCDPISAGSRLQSFLPINLRCYQGLACGISHQVHPLASLAKEDDTPGMNWWIPKSHRGI